MYFPFGVTTLLYQLNGYGQMTSSRGMNGYTQLTGWGTSWRGERGQITPYLHLGRTAYAILDDAGNAYEDNYGEGNRYTWAFKTNESEDKFAILAPDGGKVADVLVSCHGTDYYSTSAADFSYDYQVENLADGWDVSVGMSETSAFPCSLKTGEAVPCDPALLMSVTASRKSDDGLVPVSYEIDGRRDLTFHFDGVEGIKKIKNIYFSCAENKWDLSGSWLSWVSYDSDLDYDLEKMSITIPKEDIAEYFYSDSSIGNTYQGSMTYIAADGTEKTAYGEWYIKVLEQSDEPLQTDISKCSVSLGQEDFVYDGKTKKPSITVKDQTSVLQEGTDYTVTYQDNVNAGTAKFVLTGKGSYRGSVTGNFTIKKASQTISCTKSYRKTYGDKPFSLDAKRTAGAGKLAYKSSDEKVAAVDSSGRITLKGVGIAVITVKAAATGNYNEVAITAKITVNPAKQAIKTLKAAKGKKLNVRWKKDAEATGYQIQCSADKKFKKGVKTIKTGKAKTTFVTFQRLKAGKKYYVRARSYKTVKVKADGEKQTLYGAWSKAKQSGKIKK